jgi:hypothetical protein
MASVKRVGATATKSPTKASKPAVDYVENEFQTALLGEHAGDTIFIHNLSGSEYHIEPTSLKPGDVDTHEAFQVNEVRSFSKEEVNNRRFKKALMSGKLRIVTEEQANQVVRDAAKLEKRSGKKNQGGLYASGLPKNSKAALMYIYECEDIDELESYRELDDREVITSAIEDRIEALEDGEFGTPESD